jgi:hypothetical protein
MAYYNLTSFIFKKKSPLSCAISSLYRHCERSAARPSASRVFEGQSHPCFSTLETILTP